MQYNPKDNLADYQNDIKCSQLGVGRMDVRHFNKVPTVNPASIHPNLRSQSVCRFQLLPITHKIDGRK